MQKAHLEEEREQQEATYKRVPWTKAEGKERQDGIDRSWNEHIPGVLKPGEWVGPRRDREPQK